MEGGGWLFGEEGGTVVDHELEEAVGGAGREVGEEGGAAGGGKCARTSSCSTRYTPPPATRRRSEIVDHRSVCLLYLGE